MNNIRIVLSIKYGRRPSINTIPIRPAITIIDLEFGASLPLSAQNVRLLIIIIVNLKSITGINKLSISKIVRSIIIRGILVRGINISRRLYFSRYITYYLLSLLNPTRRDIGLNVRFLS